MTIPSERTRAVLAAGDMLVDLINPSVTTRVPRAIRQRALRVLRHYPWAMHMKQTAEECPELWGKPT